MRHIGYVEVPADEAMNAGAALVAWVEAMRKDMKQKEVEAAYQRLRGLWEGRGWLYRRRPPPSRAEAVAEVERGYQVSINGVHWHRLPAKWEAFGQDQKEIGDELMQLAFAAGRDTDTVWITNEAAGYYRNRDWYYREANRLAPLNADKTL